MEDFDEEDDFFDEEDVLEKMEDFEEEEDFFEEEEVLENAVLCPTCDDVTGHDILREKEIGKR